MNQHVVFVIISLTLSLFIQAQGQDIFYGSNNGKYLEVKGTHIYYEEYGEGMPLLLLHGGGGSIADFEQVIPALAQKFRVIAIDSPGLGRSQMADSLSYQLLADYFSGCMDALKLDSVYIIGWSDGGVAALILAADLPDKVRRAIVSGANSRLDGITDEEIEGVSSLTPEVVENNWGDWKEAYIRKAYEGNDWKELVTDLGAMWRQEIYIPQDKIESISARFLIVLGDRDAIKLEHGIELYRAIEGSQFLVMPNTSHWVFGEQPDLITSIGIDFLLDK